MALRLQIISRHRQGLGERGAMEFGQSGGTIGRSLESDWVLPDGQRYLSSRHASIDFRSGAYYIVDTSTNGVFVNDSEQPVGRGNPQRLFTGDRIRLGDYEMSVEITDEDTNEAFNDQHVDPVSKAQRVPPPDPTRADLVAPHEITAVGIAMLIDEDTESSQIRQLTTANAASLRLEDDFARTKPHAAAPPVKAKAADASLDETGASLAPAAPTARRPEPPPVSAAARVAARTAPAPPKPIPTPVAAAAPPPAPPAPSLDAFFRGAGVQAQWLDEKQAELVLQRLGQLMREVVLGANENLHVTAEQKNAMRVTTREPQTKNALKTSTSVDEALTHLLLSDSAEYLPAVDSVRDAFAEIKQHQQHLLAAMRAAVSDYIARLDPDELENKIGRGSGLLSAANKLKYWDLFKDLYQVVAQRQPGQFPHQFIEELARAYELEVSRSAPSPTGRQAKLG
jgi:type VI secretion system FHA domain protein